MTQFNTSKIEEGGFGAIPAGKYIALIKKVEWKPTNAGDGHYLNITFVVQTKKHKGSHIWMLLNLDNPSDKAVEIAEQNLKEMTRAIYGKDKDYGDLKGALKALPGKIVGINVDDSEEWNGKTKNTVTGFYNVDGESDSTPDGAPWDTDKADKKKKKKKGKKGMK